MTDEEEKEEKRKKMEERLSLNTGDEGEGEGERWKRRRKKEVGWVGEGCVCERDEIEFKIKVIENSSQKVRDRKK